MTNVRRCRFAFVASSVLVGFPAGEVNAQTQNWLEVGVLDCTIGPSIGLVMGARQHARCFYKAANTAGTTSYVGRLERVGKAEGLPSGGKLIWNVVATDAAKKELPGRYLAPSQESQVGEIGPHTVCRPINEAICLRPAAQGDRWKPNLAFAIAAFRLETSPAPSRRRQEKRP